MVCAMRPSPWMGLIVTHHDSPTRSAQIGKTFPAAMLVAELLFVPLDGVEDRALVDWLRVFAAGRDVGPDRMSHAGLKQPCPPPDRGGGGGGGGPAAAGPGLRRGLEAEHSHSSLTPHDGAHAWLAQLGALYDHKPPARAPGQRGRDHGPGDPAGAGGGAGEPTMTSTARWQRWGVLLWVAIQVGPSCPFRPCWHRAAQVRIQLHLACPPSRSLF